MSKTFSELGVHSNLIRGLNALKIFEATEIQEKTIPFILNKQSDFVGLGKTGTGKTAAFGLPLLQLVDANKDNIQTLILTPTRELGQQIYTNLISYAAHLKNVSIACICGGVPIKPQIERLKQTVHITIATPGRLIDLIQRGEIDITNTQNFVLDEADEMVTSLKEGLDKIVKVLPKKRRTFLFTATMSGEIKQLIQKYLSKEVTQVSVDMNVSGNRKIDHEYVVVEPIEKLDVLMHFLNSNEKSQGIIFCKTKAAVNKLAKNLAINKFSSGAIHGSLSQGIRDRIMGQFRMGHINILVATDLAARGIDVKGIAFVVNYHLPDRYDTYVHRSGRTARAGADGLSLSIIQKEEIQELEDFERELGITFHQFPKVDAESIEANNGLLWARKIFKTKPNHNISSEYKQKIHTIFHHLTKDELVEKLFAHYLIQNEAKPLIKETPKKKKSN